MERDTLLAQIQTAEFIKSGGWIRPSEPLELSGGVRWTPDYCNGEGVMAILLGGELPAFMRKRLLAAHAANMAVLCLVDQAALGSAEVLEVLAAVCAEVSLVSDDGITDPLALLKFLATNECAVDADTRRRLVEFGIAACRSAATNDRKGKTLEWLLHFMFSQVQDFRVIKCNYRTATEELDVAIQLSAINPQRCWADMSKPILVAEAKNWTSKVGQEIVSKLNTIISVKRGACKIGFVVAMAGFTSDARDQVLKLATEDRVFVLMDQQALERWGYAQDFDAELNAIVVEAILD